MNHEKRKEFIIRKWVILCTLSVAVFTIAATVPAGATESPGIMVPGSTTTLTINSIPSGATLLIDGINAGVTPYTTTRISAGNHSVLLKMAGYADYPDMVTTSTRAPVTRHYTLVPVTTTPAFSPGRNVPVIAGGRLLTLVTTPTPALSGRLVPVATTTPFLIRTGFSVPALTTITAAGEHGTRAGHPAAPARNLTMPSLQTFIGRQKQTVGQLSRNVYYTSVRPASPSVLEVPSKTLIQVSKEYQKEVDICYAPQSTTHHGGVTPTVSEGGTTPCEQTYQDIWGERADPYNISTRLENYRFRWATDATNVTQGRWQVSIYPFPDRLNNWDKPPGLVAYGTVSGKPSAGGTVFTIPFTLFMNLSYGSPPVNVDLSRHPKYSFGAPGGFIELNSYPLMAGKEVTGVKFLNNAGIGIVTSEVHIGPYAMGIPSGLMALPSAGDMKYVKGAMYGDDLMRSVLAPGALSTKMASHERVYYVRIVALNASGEPADKPSPDVEMHIKGAPLYMLPRDVKTTISVITAKCKATEFPGPCGASNVNGLNSGTSEASVFSGTSRDWSNEATMPGTELNGMVFNWTTSEPDVHAGKWQLLRTNYPMDGYDWEHPNGFIAEGVVSADKYFRIDLQKYNLPPSSIPDVGYPSGAYYIRMLPLGPDNKVTGPPARPVIIYVVNAQPIATYSCDPAAVIRDRHPPSISLVGYTPIQSAQPDANAHFIWTTECSSGECALMFGPHHVGDTVYFSNERSWWDDFCDFIGDVVSFIGDVVNWVSDAWNTIKDFAIDAVASAIPFCSDSDVCRNSLGGALDYGLATMGIPPTLPTFSDLENMGTDYLVELGASEIGADNVISPDDVRGAASSLIAQHKSQVQSGPQAGLMTGLVPNPQFQHKPAYIDIVVSNPNNEPTDPSVLRYYDHLDNNLYPDPTSGNPGYAAAHIPQSPEDRLFRPKEMPIPSLQPNQSYHIPIVLEEDFGYWGNNTGYGGMGALFPEQAFFANYYDSSFTVHIDTPDMRDPVTTQFIYFGSPPPASACTKEIHAPAEGWVQSTIQPFTVTPPRNCYSGSATCTQPYQNEGVWGL